MAAAGSLRPEGGALLGKTACITTASKGLALFGHERSIVGPDDTKRRVAVHAGHRRFHSLLDDHSSFWMLLVANNSFLT